MRRLVQRYHLDALCFLGQHYIEKMTGAPARLGAIAGPDFAVWIGASISSSISMTPPTLVETRMSFL